MKNKLGLLMVAGILAMTFSCGSKSGQSESATEKDTTAVVKPDTTAKTAQDTVKAK